MANKIETVKLPRNVWLQEVGAHLGKPAGELKAGDVTVWNWGSTSKVTEIVRTTATMIVVKFESGHTRRMRKGTLVAIENAGILRGVTKQESEQGYKWRTVAA